MNTIYKAIPNQSNINITYLDESLQFIGNDVESITIEDIQFGSTLIFEDFESLSEINIKSPGAVISFNKYPDKTIKIKGPFEEIRVKDKDDFYVLHRYGSNPTLPIDNIWGALITRDANVECEGTDALMIKTNKVEMLNLSQDWSHITIVGDEYLSEINVTGKRVIRSLNVHKGPALTNINIKRRVLSCSLNRCPVVDTIIGFGDRLSIHPVPENDAMLSIGGFWYKVPGWYDQQLALLKIPQFKAHLTAQDISDCNDLGGVKIQAYNYDMNGGQVQFSEVLGIDIETAAYGVEIQEMIRLIEEKKEPAFGLLESWCGCDPDSLELDLFDQYKVMRILASLISRGYKQEPILRLRNKISKMNTEFPKLVSCSVNDRNKGGKWRPLRQNNSEEWETPEHSVMSFGRVDLEIWLNTDKEIEFLGIDDQNKVPRPRYARQKRPEQKIAFRNLITATLSAANTVGRNSHAEQKLTKLAESLYTNPIFNTNRVCCEFTVYHLNVSRVATKPIINALIDGIMSMTAAAWVRAALLVGVVDITNSSRARIALKKLVSGKGISVSESLMIDTISIAGRRAFQSGKVEKLDWPYIENWQKKYRIN